MLGERARRKTRHRNIVLRPVGINDSAENCSINRAAAQNLLSQSEPDAVFSLSHVGGSPSTGLLVVELKIRRFLINVYVKEIY